MSNHDHNRLSERRAKRFWITFVVALMGLQTVIGATAITLSVNNPTSAVVPNYYTEAMNWDESKAKYLQLAKNQWDVKIVPGTNTTSGVRLITITIVDNDGKPVSGLEINGQTFHHARGRETVTLTFQEDEVGHYVALGPLLRPGLWEFEISIQGENESAFHKTLELT